MCTKEKALLFHQPAQKECKYDGFSVLRWLVLFLKVFFLCESFKDSQEPELESLQKRHLCLVQV